MTMTDPTADFLTRIRNGLHAQHDAVEAPASRLSTEIARILKEQGYIEGYEVQPRETRRAGEWVLVRLRYTEDRQSVISGLRRVSRPGRRTYVDAKHIPKILGGMGTTILSTSQGVMTGHDARQRGIGGEVLAEVW
jgi:small subunit ribosomal protein S8